MVLSNLSAIFLPSYFKAKFGKGIIVMSKFFYIASTILFLCVAIYLNSCASGGLVDPTDPVIPAPEIKDGNVDPATRAITITKDGITVTMEHWSRTRLNRKYTSASSRSPFYYLETWEQAYQHEVFHVTIKNDTNRNVLIEAKDTKMEDERKYVYRPMGTFDFRNKFVTKKMMDIKTNKGLEISSQIVLTEVYANRRPIGPGKTGEGFLVFNLPSSQATKVWVTLVLEREPEIATAAYQRIEFKFDYIQDLVKRNHQPPVKR